MTWTQQVADTFTDAHGTLIHDHTPDVGGAWTTTDPGANEPFIFGSQIGGGSSMGGALNAATLADKQAAEIASINNSDQIGVVVRGFDSSGMNGYLFWKFSVFGGSLYKITGGSFGSALATSASQIFGGDTIRIEADGDDITCLVNGSTYLTYTDSSSPFTSGSAGFFVSGGSFQGDNFAAYDEAGGGFIDNTANILRALWGGMALGA